MPESTNISYATHTASPWFGCSRVSAGCQNCYSEELTLKYKWAGWGDKSPRVRSKGFWKEAYRWDRAHQKKAQNYPDACELGHRLSAGAQAMLGNKTCPAKHREGKFDASVPKCGAEIIKGVPLERPRMFTSLMDWLDPMVPIEWLADFLKVVHDCQNLDWLLLSKRPELWKERIDAVCRLWACDGSYRETPESIVYHDMLCPWRAGDAPANVWFGVSVENQAMADKRIPMLLSIPAKVRWLSVEPLLEDVDLAGGDYNYLAGCGTGYRNGFGDIGILGKKVDWVVVGGESGSKRRDCGVDAIVNVAEQCQAAGVPCFVKQDCAQKPGQKGRIPDDIWALKQYPT